MAEYVGAAFEFFVLDRTYAKPQHRFSVAGVVDEPPVTPYAFGDYFEGGVVHSPAMPEDGLAAVVGDEFSVGYGWFDAVHILPRTVVAVGTIVSQVIETFEIFSAHRVPISFSDFANNVGEGVTIPDLPTPVVTIAPFTGFVDPDSERLDYLPMEILIARDGVPLFDGTLDFTFSTGQVVQLRLTGSRVSLIPFPFEEPVDERLQFSVDHIASDDGSEQAIEILPNPIQYFIGRFMLTGTDRQRMQMLLHGAQSQLLAMGVWHEAIKSTAASTAGATSIAVEATTDCDFRVGGLAVIYESALKYDVVELSAVDANSLSFDGTPTLSSYDAGVQVLPVRLGYFTNDLSGSRRPNRVEEFAFVFRVFDNDTGAMTGSTSGWSTYGGLVLLDDPNLMGGASVPETFAQRIHIVDNQSGRIDVLTDWRTNRRHGTKGFMMRSRADVMRVKRLLLALGGPRVKFRVPSAIEDLTPVANLVSTSFTMDVEHIGIAKFSQAREPKKHFRITFTDGSSLSREIASVVELDSQTERLTLTEAWPANRTVDEIVRVEFLELMRFDTQTFSFRFQRSGLAKMIAPTRTLLVSE